MSRHPVACLTATGHSFEELLANAAILRLYTVMEWATVSKAKFSSCAPILNRVVSFAP